MKLKMWPYCNHGNGTESTELSQCKSIPEAVQEKVFALKFDE